MSCFASAGVEPGDIVVSGDAQQTMTYGMDFERLWYWNLKPEQADKLARLAVSECQVDYVRVGIDGGAEFEEGQFDWSVYDKQLDCMTRLQAANPKLKFFASPRPFHEAIHDRYDKNSVQAKNSPYTCFPLWIGVFENPYSDKRKFQQFKWDKAADYLVRQIQFFNRKGFPIAYVDVKNENDVYYFAPELKQMVLRMRQQLGDQMPKVIAPSSYSWRNGVKWMEQAIKTGNADFFDIAASHNTRNQGSPEEFVSLARSLNRPVWNTELHSFHGPDDEAVANTQILWQHIRAGFSGINDWLSLGNRKKTHKMFRNVRGEVEVMRTYYIFKQLVNTSGGGRYLPTNIPDNLTTTAAFIKGDLLTVWVLNSSPKDVKDMTVRLPGRRLTEATIQVMHWGPDNRREGVPSHTKMTAADSFTIDALANSLYCFTVHVAPSEN
ncbi:hypothetical protein HED60_00715 [Planctomycetales bacterium ZRK34]|nr:hypothetical protein HED60_00715 [Planctomycetales bacterium ZRK34]